MQKMGYTTVALVMLGLALTLAAGCLSFGGVADQVTGHQNSAAPAPAAASKSMIGESGSWGGAGTTVRISTAVPTSAPFGSDSYSVNDEKIVKTAYVTLEVKDVPGATDTLKSLATAQGGYVSSSSMNRDSANRVYASVTIRVPVTAFDQTMEQLKPVGTVVSAQSSAQDVTEEYVDLNAQKTALQNQLDQYNKILAKADKVEDVLNVQVQIERVQVELDRIEGRLKYLGSQVDYSTITVSLQEPAPIGGGVTHDFNEVINSGIAAFLGVIDALIVLLFVVLPFAIIGGIGYGIYRWYKGRHPAGTGSGPGEEEKK